MGHPFRGRGTIWRVLGRGRGPLVARGRPDDRCDLMGSLTRTRPRLHKAGWALTAAGRQAHGSNWSSAADIAPCRAWKAASRSASGCRCDIAVLLSIRAAVSSSCSAYQAAIRSCSAAIRWVYTDLAQRRADASEGRGELILMGLPAHQHRPTAPLRTGNAQRYPLPGGNSPGRA